MTSKTTKRSKIQNPNEKSVGFLWAVVAIVVIAIAVIAYVVISGNKSQDAKIAETYNENTSFSTKLDDSSSILLAADNVAKDAPVVDLYEDYSCHFCADLAKNTDGDMKKLIEDGKIKLHIRTLNFLDDQNGDGKAEEAHSTKAGTAAYTLVKDDDPKVYWNFRAMLMAQQQDIWNKKELKDFAEMAKTLGAKDETVQKIKDGTYTEEFKKLAESNSKKLEQDGGNVSSPRVFIDGKEFKSNKISDWLKEIK